MDLIAAAAVGAALAMDAMTAAVSCGLKNKGRRSRAALLTAALFGVFQALMPVLGWSIGKVGSGWIGNYDHIAAFVILVLLGIKMIVDSRNEKHSGFSAQGLRELLLLSIATSIDALALGITLPATVGADTSWSMLTAVLVIGVVTFVMSFAGYYFGSAFRGGRGFYAGLIGGVLLIGIGIKTLLAG